MHTLPVAALLFLSEPMLLKHGQGIGIAVGTSPWGTHTRVSREIAITSVVPGFGTACEPRELWMELG